MEPLLLSWMFDKRWLWGLQNPCMQFVLLVPLAANLATIAGILLERSRRALQIEVEANFIILLTAHCLLAMLNLLLLLKTYIQSEQKLNKATENYAAIRSFMHNFEGRKNIWSWLGLTITLLTVVETVFNKLYLNYWSPIYPCHANIIRFYTDIAAWSYLGLVFLLFLLFKLGFLLFAWKHPEKYLRYKQVI